MVTLARIRQDLALAEKATKEPWAYDTYNTLFSGSSHTRDLKVICSIPDHPDGETYFEPEQITERSEWYAESQANIKLIERARIALPEYAKALMEAMEAIKHTLYCEDGSACEGCPIAAELLAAYHAQEGKTE